MKKKLITTCGNVQKTSQLDCDKNNVLKLIDLNVLIEYKLFHEIFQ